MKKCGELFTEKSISEKVQTEQIEKAKNTMKVSHIIKTFFLYTNIVRMLFCSPVSVVHHIHSDYFIMFCATIKINAHSYHTVIPFNQLL